MNRADIRMLSVTAATVALLGGCQQYGQPTMEPGPVETEPVETEPAPERAPAPEPANATDRRIHDEVHAALRRAPDIDASQLRVVVDQRVVRISGAADSLAAKDRIHAVAHSVSGVESVIVDDVEVSY